MDLLDSIPGQTAASRRALIRGAIVGIVGLSGAVTAQTGGEKALTYLKDDTNDDEEATIQSAELNTDPRENDEGDGTDDGDGGRAKAVISQVDLTERDGRVTLRLGSYERVVADYNQADGNSVGHSAWRVDGKLAARSGVSFRAQEGNTIQVTLQNPTPIPYSLSVRTDDGDGNWLQADEYGVTVYAGSAETFVLDELTQGEYAYELDTLTRRIEPLVGRFLIDSKAGTNS